MSLIPFQVLEVGETAGGLEFVVDMGRRSHRLDFVVDRLELLVFRNDGMRCRLGHMRIGREHHGHRLADEADLLVRQNWLVVKGRPVIGIAESPCARRRSVITRKTPGIFCASLTSTDLMRPCATVLRKIFPCSMPGTRIKCVYSARPVTFSRASRRGIERPIWPPPIGLVASAIGSAQSLHVVFFGSWVHGYLAMNPRRKSTIFAIDQSHNGSA